MAAVTRHGDYWCLIADELPRLTSLLVEHHPGARLLVTSSDSGPYAPEPRELAAGWARAGAVAIGPPISNELPLRSAGFDEWYVFDELPTASFEPEVFVSYVPFPLTSIATSIDEPWPWLSEASNRLWQQLATFRPVSYVARAHEDVVISRCERFVLALSGSGGS